MLKLLLILFCFSLQTRAADDASPNVVASEVVITEEETRNQTAEELLDSDNQTFTAQGLLSLWSLYLRKSSKAQISDITFQLGAEVAGKNRPCKNNPIGSICFTATTSPQTTEKRTIHVSCALLDRSSASLIPNPRTPMECDCQGDHFGDCFSPKTNKILNEQLPLLHSMTFLVRDGLGSKKRKDVTVSCDSGPNCQALINNLGKLRGHDDNHQQDPVQLPAPDQIAEQ